jgi:hypothetical protein
VELLYYVPGSEQVKAGYFAVSGAHHGESLSGASLTVSEARSHGSFESFSHERQDTVMVYSFVIIMLIKHIVVLVCMLKYHLRHIYFMPD